MDGDHTCARSLTKAPKVLLGSLEPAMDGLKLTRLYYIKQNGVFVGVICLCICLSVTRPNVERTLPLVDLASRDFFIPAT